WIDEAIGVEGADVAFGRIAVVAEDQLEVGVGRDGGGAVGRQRADVDAFVYRLEQSRERRRSTIHAAIICGRLRGGRGSGFRVLGARFAYGSGFKVPSS